MYKHVLYTNDYGDNCIIIDIVVAAVDKGDDDDDDDLIIMTTTNMCIFSSLNFDSIISQLHWSGNWMWMLL